MKVLCDRMKSEIENERFHIIFNSLSILHCLNVLVSSFVDFAVGFCDLGKEEDWVGIVRGGGVEGRG